MANLTLEDIANISFPRANFGGYRAEDVDAFIDDVQVSYDNVLKESAELKRKLAILAQKVEEYRNEEDSIRNTLLSAQKLADASVREAKHKAEVIVADATEKAERIILGAQKEADSQKGELGRLKEEVAAFRTKLLTVYKEHLQIIQQLPVEEETLNRQKNRRPLSRKRLRRRPVRRPRRKSRRRRSWPPIRRNWKKLRFTSPWAIPRRRCPRQRR